MLTITLNRNISVRKIHSEMPQWSGVTFAMCYNTIPFHSFLCSDTYQTRWDPSIIQKANETSFFIFLFLFFWVFKYHLSHKLPTSSPYKLLSLIFIFSMTYLSNSTELCISQITKVSFLLSSYLLHLVLGGGGIVWRAWWNGTEGVWAVIFFGAMVLADIFSL